MISTSQRHTGNGDNGTQPLPMNERPGIVIPTPENLNRIAANAAAQRQRETEARNSNPQDLSRAWGVSRDMILFLQRLEGKVIELEREVAQLRRGNNLPVHLRDVEKR